MHGPPIHETTFRRRRRAAVILAALMATSILALLLDFIVMFDLKLARYVIFSFIAAHVLIAVYLVQLTHRGGRLGETFEVWDFSGMGLMFTSWWLARDVMDKAAWAPWVVLILAGILVYLVRYRLRELCSPC